MTSLQEQMLNKIALNKNNLVLGEEPENCYQTLVFKQDVLSSPMDQAVITSLLRAGLIIEEDDTIQLTEQGFRIFEDL